MVFMPLIKMMMQKFSFVNKSYQEFMKDRDSGDDDSESDDEPVESDDEPVESDDEPVESEGESIKVESEEEFQATQDDDDNWGNADGNESDDSLL